MSYDDTEGWDDLARRARADAQQAHAESHATACARALRGIEDPEGAVKTLVRVAEEMAACLDPESEEYEAASAALAPFLAAREQETPNES